MEIDENVELWDAYNNNFAKIDGMLLQRGKSIPEGVYHLVCDIIVKHADGSYLLMQRDFKKHLGGLWEQQLKDQLYLVKLLLNVRKEN